MTRNARRIGPFGLSLALALVIGGCGGGSSSSTTTATPAAAATRASTPAAAVPAVHLSVLSPHTGAHTGSTVTVHVALSGAPGGTTPRFHYILDHRLSRSGSSTLTFHDLAPGRHRVQVLVVPGSAARASTTFIVRAPAPAPLPTPVEAPATTATPPPATTSTPEPVHTTPKAPPAKASPPESSGGIPQGGGGDGDGDNSGGPSDGDGNI